MACISDCTAPSATCGEYWKTERKWLHLVIIQSTLIIVIDVQVPPIHKRLQACMHARTHTTHIHILMCNDDVAECRAVCSECGTVDAAQCACACENGWMGNHCDGEPNRPAALLSCHPRQEHRMAQNKKAICLPSVLST